MSDKPQTTETPWKIRDRTARGEGFTIYSVTGHYSRSNVAHYVSEHDAALIVTAVNAHAALLEACKEFVRKVECGEALSVKSYAQMKAAIALAEGEKE